MKRLFCLAFAAVAGGAAVAQEYYGGELREVDHFTVGQAESRVGTTAGVIYDNTTNFLGSAFVHGGTANQSNNLITRMFMDDINTVGAIAGEDISKFTFSVFNGNATSVSVRARARFWFDGANAPGTYYNDNDTATAVGFSFAAFNFAPGVTLLTGTIAAGTMNSPTGKIWAGLTFDNNTGATGATQAQMDMFGQGFFNPPAIGTSADQIFGTTAAGSFFGVNNPAGAIATFGGQPVANLGWKFEAVPEPGSMIALGAGIAAVLARRRKKA